MSGGLTLSVAEAAAQLDVTEAWLSREASAGRIPSLKIGRSRRFTEAGLAEYLEKARYVAADPLTQTPASRARRRRAT